MDPVILIVDDNDDNRYTLATRLQLCGYSRIEIATNGKEALGRLRSETINLVLLDMLMPGLDGSAVLKEMKSDTALREIPVIVISAVDDASRAAHCIELGAVDYLTKPFNPLMLKARVDSCVERLPLRLRGTEDLHTRLIGRSAPMVALREQILQLAPINVPVLIYGETGTGKEVVAQCLHDLGPRSKHPFVAINCAAVPESIFESEFFGHEAGAFTGAGGRRIGRFEYASRGSMLLDEIEAMPLHLQAKVLRVLQEQTLERLGSNKSISVDVRILAAAKVDLFKASQAGRFREDLYFRLNVAELHIPPLRERKEDIPDLFEAFVKDAARRYQTAPRFPTVRQLDELLQRQWPGNVRELRTAAERFCLSLDKSSEAWPAKQEGTLPLANQVAAFERMAIERTLHRHNGDMDLVQTDLNLPRRTLYHKMQRYGILREQYIKSDSVEDAGNA